MQVDGLLALCDSTACVSSQDDAAGGGRCFAEPWEYDAPLAEAFTVLRTAVQNGVGATKEEVVTVVRVAEASDYKYLRAFYTNEAKNTIDDAEWFLPGEFRDSQ